MQPERLAVIGQGAVGRFLSERVGAEVLPRDAAPPAGLWAIFLAVPDGAIAALAARLRAQTDAPLIHCSGATALAALGPGRGAVWHPMAAFGRGEPAADLGGAVVGLRGDDALLVRLETLTTAMGGQPVRIAEADAPRVHAACCFAAGFSAAVVALAQQQLKASGLDDGPARDAVRALSQTAIGAMLDGRGLTGPAVRDDVETIEAHRAVLPQWRSLYDELTELMRALQPPAPKP